MRHISYISQIIFSLECNLLIVSAMSQKVNTYKIATRQVIYSHIWVSTVMVPLVEHTDRTQIFSFLGQAFCTNPAQRPRVACSSPATHQWLTKSPGWVHACSLWSHILTSCGPKASRATCWNVYRPTSDNECPPASPTNKPLANKQANFSRPAGLVNALPC